MGFVLAGFCAVNCWVIPKLWEPVRMRRIAVIPTPPRGGTVVRIRPVARMALHRAAQPGLLLAA